MSSYEPLLSVWNKTITYSNIFDYPLTTEEIYIYAITGRQISKNEFDSWYTKNQSKLLQRYVHDGTYWALPNREAIFVTREKRNDISKKKRSSAKWFTFPLFLMPWIKLVAITGTTAANNARVTDDTDLYIVTSPNRTWLTRSIVLAYFTVFGKRHDVKNQKNNSGYCLNHVVDTHSLKDPNEDVYVANEIARMQVLWSRSRVFSKLVSNNEWVSQYLRQWYTAHKPEYIPAPKKTSENSNVLDAVAFIIAAPFKTPFVLASWVFDWLESVTKNIQQGRLKRQKAKDENLLTFHIHDNRDWILREFNGTVGEI